MSERPRRTGRPKEAILSTNLIRDQALAIIDEEGLAALTMRGLANRLGVQAASLYAHFANKDAVLAAIAARLAKRIDTTGFADSWQTGLRRWSESFYAAVRLHPNASPIVAAGAHEHSDYVALADQVHRELVAQGWPPSHATMVAASARFLVLGAASAAVGETLASRAGEKRSLPAHLDQFAGTIERASFTLALESLILGLESVYESVKRDVDVTGVPLSAPSAS